jgi:WD40 repeat protein
LAFSPDGTQLATGGRYERARIWDLHSGVLVQDLAILTPYGVPSAPSVAFSPDGTQLATGSTDKTARISDIAVG